MAERINALLRSEPLIKYNTLPFSKVEIIELWLRDLPRFTTRPKWPTVKLKPFLPNLNCKRMKIETGESESESESRKSDERNV